MKTLKTIALIIPVIFLTGCYKIVTPGIATQISSEASNARVIAVKTQDTEYYEKIGDEYKPAPYVNQWFEANAESWTNLSDWANGVKD